MKPTIYDIKEATEAKSPFFFDRKTMRGFGQTMRDFKVHQSPKGNIYIVAPMYRTKTNYSTGKREFIHIGYTFRRFEGNDLRIIPKFNYDDFDSRAKIEAYIQAN